MVCRFCQVAKPIVPHKMNTCPAYLRYEIGRVEREMDRVMTPNGTHPWHPSIFENYLAYRNKLASALVRADKRISDATLKKQQAQATMRRVALLNASQPVPAVE